MWYRKETIGSMVWRELDLGFLWIYAVGGYTLVVLFGNIIIQKKHKWSFNKMWYSTITLHWYIWNGETIEINF